MNGRNQSDLRKFVGCSLGRSSEVASTVLTRVPMSLIPRERFVRRRRFAGVNRDTTKQDGRIEVTRAKGTVSSLEKRSRTSVSSILQCTYVTRTFSSARLPSPRTRRKITYFESLGTSAFPLVLYSSFFLLTHSVVPLSPLLPFFPRDLCFCI